MNDIYKQFMDDFDLKSFIGYAVREILRREDPIQFNTWLKNALPNYLPKEFTHDIDQGQYNSMAWCLAYKIWNATPLPGHHYKPNPQSKPTRNTPCPCGSGVKFKQCCRKSFSLLNIESEYIWPLVLDFLPKQKLQDAIKNKMLPVEALINLTENYIAENRPRKGVALLEPLFTDSKRKGDEKYEYALNMLCNLYDELNFHNKKLRLLHRIVENQPRCPLRSGAWQRLATIHMDTGDHPAAWQAFQNAHRDDPDSVWVGLLELQLLVAENKQEQAKRRAEFWVRRLEKMGYRHDEPPMDIFIKAALDPLNMMQDISMEMTDGMGAGLLSWLQKVSKRPLPEYRVLDHSQDIEGDDEKIIEAHLRSLGFPEDEIHSELDRLKEESGHEEKGEEADEFVDADNSLFLVSPEVISSMEQEWHLVFPLAKPLSTHDECFGAEDAWDFADEAAWTGFLEQHPEAFDSLDILDDLATALMQHEHFGHAWLDDRLLRPVLQRAGDIIKLALSTQTQPHLTWLFMENRQALRSLARLAMLQLNANNQEEAYTLMQYMLELNPGDNHGFRSMVINRLLQEGKDDDALALAKHYQEDAMAEIVYGRVLALYRLGKKGEALSALYEAMQHLPKVIVYLSREKVRKPKIDFHGIQYGGDDQAWLYRKDMRDIWLATPGMKDWLKQASRLV